MIIDTFLGARDATLLAPMLKQMAEAWRTVSFAAVTLSDFNWVDREKLDYYENEFRELGFEVLGDFSPQPSLNRVVGFMRLMGSQEEKAYASLHTTMPKIGGAQPLKCAISCSLSQDWVVAGTDREADPILSQLRLPKIVSLRDCDAKPADLWRDVAALRAQLASELNLQLEGEVSANNFIAQSQHSNRARADLVDKQNPLKFAIRRRALIRSNLSHREIVTGDWKPKNPLSI